MKIKLTIVLIITSLFFAKLYAQDKKDISFTKELFNYSEHKVIYNTGVNNKTPIHFVFTQLFLFYKHCISSQDHPSCNFTPSCSEYSLKAIKNKGVFIGILATFDRLNRCNNPYADGYLFDEKTHKLKDDL